MPGMKDAHWIEVNFSTFRNQEISVISSTILGIPLNAFIVQHLMALCFCFLFSYIYLFYFYFWLCWVFVSVRGLSLVAVSGGHSSLRCAGLSLSRPLFVAEHRLQTRRLSSCGSRAQLIHGMWDLPRPGLKPVSPALAGRFSTTVPPGKPSPAFLNTVILMLPF